MRKQGAVVISVLPPGETSHLQSRVTRGPPVRPPGLRASPGLRRVPPCGGSYGPCAGLFGVSLPVTELWDQGGLGSPRIIREPGAESLAAVLGGRTSVAGYGWGGQ